MAFVVELGHAYAVAGRADDAPGVLKQLQETSGERYVNAWWVAEIYAALNEREEAFHWLEKAYQERSALMAYTKMDPWFDGLRSDPRFQDLLQRIYFGLRSTEQNPAVLPHS